MGMRSFKLIWRNGAYYVSEPNIDTCEVVRLADALERERVLREALDTMLKLPKDGAWTAKQVDFWKAARKQARAALAQ